MMLRALPCVRCSARCGRRNADGRGGWRRNRRANRRQSVSLRIDSAKALVSLSAIARNQPTVRHPLHARILAMKLPNRRFKGSICSIGFDMRGPYL